MQPPRVASRWGERLCFSSSISLHLVSYRFASGWDHILSPPRTSRLSETPILALARYAGAGSSRFLCSDGDTQWVADWRERVDACRLSNGMRGPQRDIDAGTEDEDPSGLWSDGGTLLTTEWGGGKMRTYPKAEIDLVRRRLGRLRRELLP